MRVLEAGHIYELEYLDVEEERARLTELLVAGDVPESGVLKWELNGDQANGLLRRVGDAGDVYEYLRGLGMERINVSRRKPEVRTDWLNEFTLRACTGGNRVVP